MKKSLVLAMAMALGVTASAYAANPFSDVPAGHWAYDSVAKLAAAGVVDGYVDGAFGGDKLMTRYEMAQIVAKAMAKGANVDKLAAEFADELDTLGVRVAKLEKGADAVKITGEVRYMYAENDGTLATANETKLRSRIWMAGQINEDWTYTAMFQNEQNLDDDVADEGTSWQRAYLNGKLGGMKVLAGRYNLKVAEGNVYDHRFDGIQLQYGKDVKLTVGAGKANARSYDEVIYANAATKLGVVPVEVGYYSFKDDANATLVAGAYDKDGKWVDAYYAGEQPEKEIFTVAANLPLTKDLKFGAMYLKGDAVAKCDDNGYVLTLAYKGAKAAVPGSWGLEAKWYDQPQATYVDHTMDGQEKAFLKDKYDGFEGYSIAATYALAKNIVAKVQYFDLDARETNDDAETLWGQVVFTF